ncbi:hypothetical protein F5Y10DRAFT_278002 [Nemania abortiva]|nr:hypothetical protein F5Y10DRAFT_278002 [Nemania abortiva]
MSIDIRDLSDELIVQITRVLARRPEYGIAQPSRRWLQRQEEKIKQLPKELLKLSGFKRLAIKIADSIDPNIVDPRAILCQTHSGLNPFLIRRLFIALAYEVTVHADPLRSWPGRTSDPELSAFVGRLDSITALWTEPRLFKEIYGLAPFDSHGIFVQSSCEACCLAAVGASGRALADLRAAIIDRMERRRERAAGKEPRLRRVVEAWIDHLRKHHDEVGRPEECRGLSEALLINLRMARPKIMAWRAEQKRRQPEQRPVYTELRRTRAGVEIAPLPASAGRERRTRNGIPVALADVEGAKRQREAAVYGDRAESIYRPDSLSPHSEVNRRQRAVRSAPIADEPRPGAPEPVRTSGLSDGLPTESFLHRFEQEMPADHGREPPDFEYEPEEEPEDDHYYEKTRARLQDWFLQRVSESQLHLNPNDTGSVLSGIHAAIRPSSHNLAGSIPPVPLHTTKDYESQAGAPWTDLTVHTDVSIPIAKDVPSILDIPSGHINWPAPLQGRLTTRDSLQPSHGSLSPNSDVRYDPAQHLASRREQLRTKESLAPRPSSSGPTTARSANTHRHSIASSSVYDKTIMDPLHRNTVKSGPRGGNATSAPRDAARTVPRPATVEDSVAPSDSIAKKPPCGLETGPY